jgi:hypothetical protein
MEDSTGMCVRKGRQALLSLERAGFGTWWARSAQSTWDEAVIGGAACAKGSSRRGWRHQAMARICNFKNELGSKLLAYLASSNKFLLHAAYEARARDDRVRQGGVDRVARDRKDQRCPCPVYMYGTTLVS